MVLVQKHKLQVRKHLARTLTSEDDQPHKHQLTHPTATNTYQEIHEDLGLNYTAFVSSGLSPTDPNRALAFERSLPSTTRLTSHARSLSSDQQYPLHMPPSLTASPTSSTSRTTHSGFLGIHASIPELACRDAPDGRCYGENGETGFAVRRASGTKERYWLDDTTAHLAPLNTILHTESSNTNTNATTTPQSALISSPPAAAKEKLSIHFPTWDQLPVEFQNPTTSADFVSSIPFCAVESSGGDGGGGGVAWDGDEGMHFAMDMDMDMDMGMGMNMHLDTGFGTDFLGASLG